MRSHQTRQQLEASAERLRSLLSDVENSLEAQDPATGPRLMADRLRSAIDESRDLLQELRSAATQRARDADLVVRDNPYATAGIAVAAGALIGFALSRTCLR